MAAEKNLADPEDWGIIPCEEFGRMLFSCADGDGISVRE